MAKYTHESKEKKAKSRARSQPKPRKDGNGASHNAKSDGNPDGKPSKAHLNGHDGSAKQDSSEGRPHIYKDEAPIAGFDPWTLRVQDELQALKPRPIHTLKVHHATVEVRPSKHSLWLVARWSGGLVALRPAFSPCGGLKVDTATKQKDGLELHVETPNGAFQIKLIVPDGKIAMLRVTTTFTPRFNIRFPFWPRDVYPIDETGDPTAVRGVVHAAQRGSCAGVLYFTVTEPMQATLLYFQNLTWMNGYAQTTETELNSVVGDSWPDLGYMPPVSEDYAMTAGEEEEWSDFLVCFCEETPVDEGHRARVFLSSLADVYRHLPPPETQYRDWRSRAEETLKAFESPKVWVREMGYDLLHPYVCAEHPDSLVQSILIPPLREYAQWAGKDIPLIDTLCRPLSLFFDEHTKSVRRYLPSVGEDKNPNEVDSWYLYHPLINLARLAQQGDEQAKDLLQKGIGFAIKAARHFNYHWPVKFNLLTLDATHKERKPGEPGESDVPGTYAYLMLQARDIFGEDWYVEEAKRALEQLRGLGFSIGYQFNNVAWGAVACARMWKETDDEYYLGMSYCFLASFFHNTILWEPDYGLTRNYSMFMGVTCLHDGNYTAMFEEYESFAAFHEYIDICGDQFAPVQLLLTEYCKFLLSRGFYYYPSDLPEEVLAKEIRNGEIDRSLAIPLEDLYPERKPAGSVGQEVYGAAAPFTLVTRSYHRLPKTSVILYCEYPVRAMTSDGKDVSFGVQGDPRVTCRLRLIPDEGTRLHAPSLHSAGKELPFHRTKEGHVEYQVPGGSSLVLSFAMQ